MGKGTNLLGEGLKGSFIVPWVKNNIGSRERDQEPL